MQRHLFTPIKLENNIYQVTRFYVCVWYSIFKAISGSTLKILHNFWKKCQSIKLLLRYQFKSIKAQTNPNKEGTSIDIPELVTSFERIKTKDVVNYIEKFISKSKQSEFHSLGNKSATLILWTNFDISLKFRFFIIEKLVSFHRQDGILLIDLNGRFLFSPNLQIWTKYRVAISTTRFQRTIIHSKLIWNCFI